MKTPEQFMQYFCSNYPGPSTLISRPDWHAPLIYRAAIEASAFDGLLQACKAQHDALDTAMAMLIILTRDLYPNEPERHFMPSQSPMFSALKQGNAAIAKAEGK